MVVKRIVVAHQFGLPSFHDWKHAIGEVRQRRLTESVGKAGPNNAVMGLEDGGSYRVAGRGIDGLDGAEP